MSDIVNRVRVIAQNCSKDLGIEIVDVEWVKEGRDFILRILADTEIGLSIEDSVALNEAISNALDVDDFIEEEYMLEVSSPGLERPIKNDEEIKKAIGEYIYIKTYAAIDGIKEFYGYLRAFDGEEVFIEVNVKGRNKDFKIEKSKISNIRFAVKF
jgi:ribosome maturation factor RimP